MGLVGGVFQEKGKGFFRYAGIVGIETASVAEKEKGRTLAVAACRVWPQADEKVGMRPLYRMDERERERSMTLLFEKEKLTEIQEEVRAKNPGLTEAKVKQIAARKYIWRYGGGLF